MRDLVDRFLDKKRPLSLVDLGSYDVNGSYRLLFNMQNVLYRGIDLEAGPGVDIVLASPYHFPLQTHSVDLIVSGQAFEHIEFFWRTWLEMNRILRPGGMIFLIAPSRGSEHRYPQDCWRFYPDGYRALAKYGSPLFVYHEIVHNTYVVDEFRKKGVIFVEDINDVPVGERVIFSAHGVSPEVRKQAAARNLELVAGEALLPDDTCAPAEAAAPKAEASKK